MDNAPAEGGSADVGPEPGETGGETVTEAAEPAGGETTEPVRQYVEVDDPDNRWDRVRVDGEDVEIPYSELKRGYSREADYTRKTQELARQRQEAQYGLSLQQALQADPETTLQILARQHGLTLAQAQQAVEQAQTFDDPLEQMLHEERQARLNLEERIAAREADQELDHAIGGLRQQFNLNDDDVRAVVYTASQMRVGTEAFPQIWKAMAYDRIAAQVQAQRAAAEQQQATTNKRQSAASAASQIVTSGTHGGNGLTDQVDVSDRKLTIREAAELAFNQYEQ
jgi:hypothetical protein